MHRPPPRWCCPRPECRRPARRQRLRRFPRGSASRRCQSPRDSGTDVVQIAGVEVEAVDDLPEGGHGLQRITTFEGRQVRVFPQHAHERRVALDQGSLGSGQLNAHRVFHACVLRWPAVPTTVRSSCNRFAFNSKRGRLPFSTFLTPKRSPSCASASDLLSSRTIRSASTPARSGISTKTSISSCRPSAV